MFDPTSAASNSEAAWQSAYTPNPRAKAEVSLGRASCPESHVVCATRCVPPAVPDLLQPVFARSVPSDQVFYNGLCKDNVAAVSPGQIIVIRTPVEGKDSEYLTKECVFVCAKVCHPLHLSLPAAPAYPVPYPFTPRCAIVLPVRVLKRVHRCLLCPPCFPASTRPGPLVGTGPTWAATCCKRTFCRWHSEANLFFSACPPNTQMLIMYLKC